MLGWFQALMPKEERFFDLFDRHAETLVAGSRALRSLLDGGENVPAAVRKSSCAKTRPTTSRAMSSWRFAARSSRPFDRSDIRDLITSMDDAIDQMHQTAKATLLYETREFEPAMRRMGDIIVQAAELTRAPFPCCARCVQNAAKLNAFSEEISRIEDEADAIHDQGLKELFPHHRISDPMAFIVGAEIYGHLEKVSMASRTSRTA